MPEAAIAQVVQPDVEIGVLGRVADAQQLVAAPVGQNLHAVDAVIPKLRAANVIGRVVQIGRQHGPIKDRHRTEVQKIVRRRGLTLVLDGRQVRGRIEHRLAGQRIDHSLFDVLEIHFVGLQAIGRLAHPAGGDERVLGKEPVRAGLLKYVGVQPQQSLIFRRRREQIGFEHRAHLVRHVVIHPLGLDHPLALAENDVPFHVQFQRDSFVLPHFGQIGHLVAGDPNHQPIGGNVDRPHLAEAGNTADGVDNHVHARVDYSDPLVAGRIGKPLDLHGHVAAGIDANPPHALGQRQRSARGLSQFLRYGRIYIAKGRIRRKNGTVPLSAGAAPGWPDNAVLVFACGTAAPGCPRRFCVFACGTAAPGCPRGFCVFACGTAAPGCPRGFRSAEGG